MTKKQTLFLLLCGLAAPAAWADAHLECDLDIPEHGTFCEDSFLGLPADEAEAFEAELQSILSAPPGTKRGEFADLKDPEVHFCMLVTDAHLSRAFARDKDRTEALIERLVHAGAFTACRTQPEYVLLMLERQDAAKRK